MPSEVNTQATTGDENASKGQVPSAQPAVSAPDLAPTQVSPDTGRAANVDVPKGQDAPAPVESDSANQSVPTNSSPARSGPEQPSTSGGGMDASALFELVKELPSGELDTLIGAIEDELGDTNDEDVDLDASSTTSQRGAQADEAVDDDTPIEYSQLDAGSRKAIGAVHSHMVEQAITQALDSDTELAYNMKQAGPKAQESVKSIIRDRLQRLVDGKGSGFDYNWDRAAEQAVASEKARLAPFFERPARPGMGPGSQTDFQMTQELKQPERVPAFADDRARDEYLMERMKYNQALVEREQDNVPGA